MTDDAPDLSAASAPIRGALSLGGVPDRIERYYDTWADTYDDDLGPDYQVPAACLGTLRTCRGRIPLDVDDPGLVVVDAGCGSGLIGAAFARAGYRTIDGVDLSPRMVDVARRRDVYRRLAAPIDLTEPPPVDWAATGDVVVCGGVYTLGHIAPESLRQLLAWVRPGGVAVVSTRRAYYDTTDFQAVVDRLVGDGTADLVSVQRDLPYTEDSTAHYWALRVPA